MRKSNPTTPTHDTHACCHGREEEEEASKRSGLLRRTILIADALTATVLSPVSCCWVKLAATLRIRCANQQQDDGCGARAIAPSRNASACPHHPHSATHQQGAYGQSASASATFPAD